MHIAASLMAVMARSSCMTVCLVCLFGASPCCNFCASKCACTVVVRSPKGGGVGDRHLATVPQGMVGGRLSWGGERQGGGGRGDVGGVLFNPKYAGHVYKITVAVDNLGPSQTHGQFFDCEVGR